MNPFVFGSGAVVLSLVLGLAQATAATRGGIYDMERMLREPHPFANQPVPGAPGTPPPAMAQPRPAPAPRPDTLAPATPAPAPAGYLGLLSEARLGLLVHDEGPFSRNEEDGLDINLEVLFVSPDMLDLIGAPRPHLGLSVNSSGDTDQLYLGLTWEWDFLRALFFDVSVGGAVHDGKITTPRLDRKELGCRALFRGAVGLGYRLSPRHSVMASFSHISNAKLCDQNEGLENYGLRYGYRF